MRCPGCGSNNPEGSTFCNRCGSGLEIRCSACGKVGPAGIKFCCECGQDLRKQRQAPPGIYYSQPKSYTPKFLLAKILSNRTAIEGERKLLTILFADIADSTAMFEKLDPEDVHLIMDGCFRILLDEIHRFEGTINQFRGDGIMALFGAPIAHEDHAQRACYAALAIQQSLVPYSEELKKKYGIDFKMRIGLNSGTVVVGSIGDDLRMDYTAQGDPANLAARLESCARPGSILVSEYTYKMTKDFFELEPLGMSKVKGKQESVGMYELLKRGQTETRIGAAAARGLTKFVGRQREIRALEEAFGKVRLGQGRVVGIVGEPGVGKSRLLHEFKKLLMAGEYLCLEGRCFHHGQSMPYLPIIDAIRVYLDIKEGERQSKITHKIKEKISEFGGAVTTMLPPLQEFLALEVDDKEFLQLEAKCKRKRTFEAIRDLLLGGTQDMPFVVVIEDLHWIDKTSEDFLDYLIRWVPTTHILLILLYRPDYSHQWGSKSYYTAVSVDELSAPATAELVKAILQGGEVVQDLQELLFNRSSGNPLFIEELTKALLENGIITLQPNQYVLANHHVDVKVPDTIQGIVSARIDRLDESLKRIIQVASVVGREFTFRILNTVTGMEEELKTHLLNLQGLEFIYETSVFPELRYIFRHALTHEVAYNSLLLERRKEIHEMVGDAIETLHHDRISEFHEILAYHYCRDLNASKAIYYLKLSGDKAKLRWSNWEAFRFYRDAVAILRHQPDDLENKRHRMEILRSMAPTIRVLGYPEDSFDLLKEGESLASELEDQKVLGWFEGYIGLYYVAWGRDALRGREYIEKSLGAADLSQDVAIIVPAIVDLVLAHAAQGFFSKICEIVPRAIDLIDHVGGQHQNFGRAVNNFSLLLAHYGMSSAAIGEFKKGEGLLRKALSFGYEIDDFGAIAATEICYGWYFYFKGDGENSEKHFRAGIEYARKSQLSLILAVAESFLGRSNLLKGEPAIAAAWFEKGLKTQTDHGIPLWLGLCHIGLAEANLELGELEDARLHAEEGLAMSQRNGERFAEGMGMLTLGRVLGGMKEWKSDEGRELIAQARGVFDELKIRPMAPVWLFYSAERNAKAGQINQALEALAQAEKMFEEMEMSCWIAKTQELMGRFR